MFKNIKWLRIVPDKPGKGGQKTGFHTFQPAPVNETREVKGWHIFRGRWRKDYISLSVPGTSPDASRRLVQSLHGYTYPSLTDPSAVASLTILGHHVDWPVLGTATNRYFDFTNNTIRSTHTGNAVPATFLNIEGRCFVADGAREGMILDDRTPAIHLQKNQNLGIGTPTQALAGTTDGNITPYGTGYVHNGSPFINHPNPNNRLGTVLTTDYVTPSTIDAWAAIYTAGAVMAAGAPAADGVSSNVTAFTATGTIAIDPAIDKSLVTLTGWTWPADFAYCGLTINFNGYSFVILETGPAVGGVTQWDVDGNVWAGATNVQLRILGKYDGPAVTGIPYTITGCQLEMGANSTLVIGSTAAASLGYSQSTASALAQIVLTVERGGSGGLYKNLGNISLGPATTDSGALGSLSSISDADMVDGTKVLASAGSSPWISADIGTPIAIDGAGAAGGVLKTTITGMVGPSSPYGAVWVADQNISGSDIVAGQAWWGADPVVSDGAMGIGSSTLTSASNPFVAGDVGQPIVIEDGGTAGTAALITTIATFVNAGEVTVTAARAALGAITGKQVWFRGVSTTTTAGPKYAYSWYDPETGHCSNISPMYQIPKPTSIGKYTDFAYITPVFQIDPGAISYPSGVDATRFSHILFFRTLSNPNTSTLYPIGSLQPYLGKVNPGSASTRGSWNPSTFHGWMGLPNNYTAAPPAVAAPQYWYDFSSDEDLILAGGFRAPQYTNEKPMALIRGGATEAGKVAYQAYWDRRLWVVCTQEPDKIMFSCDEAQCPLGVPVESFPPTNYLRIPSVDGRVVGMKTVGEMLLITTDRWAYTIAGNNESNYRLLRISTRMGGVGNGQMSEITSDVEGQSAIVYFLGTDKIVYEWVVGGPVQAISEPVQNVLNSRITSRSGYRYMRLHCSSANARRLLTVSFGWNYTDFLTFDIQNRVWTTNHVDYNSVVQTGPSAMTTVYGTDPPVNELWSGQNSTTFFPNVYSWLRDDTFVQQVSTDNVIATFPLDFDGLKTRKQLVAVNLHCSTGVPGTPAWTCLVRVNEGPWISSAFGNYPDLLESVYSSAVGAFPEDSSVATDLVVMTAAFNPDNSALVGYRFIVGVSTNSPVNATLTPTEVYAIDIGYVDWQEQGEGDP